MNKKNNAIFLVLFTTILTSTAQFLYKFGIEKVNLDFFSILFNWQILSGLFLYAIGAVILIIALKQGELSVLYPIVATSYVWVSIGSLIFFNSFFLSLILVSN